jgi:N-hydroxyarylamine O-acetyltransferase
MDDPWRIGDLDLEAYLAHIGEPERAPSREALAALHRAHRRAFSFENLDVLLGQHPGVSLEAVQAKFVGGTRGGYCFEQITLFAAAVERLGYAVVRHLARVGHPSQSPRTHLVALVELDGERLLCDLGFGWSLLEPMPVHDGSEVEQDGWRFRITRRDDRGSDLWELARWHHDMWEPLHWIDEAVVHPIDVEMGHHWTSTHPRTHFRSSLMVTGLTEDGAFLGLSLDGVTERRPGLPTRHTQLPTGANELGRQLARVRIRPTPDELDRLEAKLAELRGRPSQ